MIINVVRFYFILTFKYIIFMYLGKYKNKINYVFVINKLQNLHITILTLKKKIVSIIFNI